MSTKVFVTGMRELKELCPEEGAQCIFCWDMNEPPNDQGYTKKHSWSCYTTAEPTVVGKGDSGGNALLDLVRRLKAK